MILIEPVYTSHDCVVIPTVAITAIPCDECEIIHAWIIQFLWLWWGVAITWGDWKQEVEA